MIMTSKINAKQSVCDNNQTALTAITSKMNRSGQHLAASILLLANRLKGQRRSTRFKLTFRWSAGHIGIARNEDADKEVKVVAEGDSSDTKDLPICLQKKIGYSLSATQQAHYKTLKHRWVTDWTASPQCNCLQLHDTLTPYSQKFLKYLSCKELSRQLASRIFQLRVGHVPLNAYLHRFKCVDNPRCPACGHPRETAEHFLLQCPNYMHKRWNITRREGGCCYVSTRCLPDLGEGIL